MEAEQHNAGLMPVLLHEEAGQAIIVNVTATMALAGLVEVLVFAKLPTQADLLVRG